MKALRSSRTLFIVAILGIHWAVGGQAIAATSVVIRIADERINATDASGEILVDQAAGEDDAGAIQSVIDASGRGGKIVLGVGHYVLDRSVVVDRSLIIEGEGRETVLVPPSDEYALRIVKTENSPIRSELEGPNKPDLLKRLEGHLYPVLVRDLSIDGDGQGKGIYLERVFNATVENVFICRTEDGAGLRVGPFAMECVFDNVVVHTCGSFEKKEAAVIISTQTEGDPGNNTRFRALEVIFPRWHAVHIGAGEGTRTPRLIFFQQCFFHGRLPFDELPPCDLIYVERCEGTRGVVNFTDCRITNTHDDYALLRVGEARVTVTGCVFGGGDARSAILVEEKGRVVAQGNAIQDTANSSKRPLEFAVETRGGQVTFTGNTVESEGGARLLLQGVKSAVITGNQFSPTPGQPTIHLADGPEGEASRKVVITSNVFAESRAESAIRRDSRRGRDIVIENNIFGGAD